MVLDSSSGSARLRGAHRRAPGTRTRSPSAAAARASVAAPSATSSSPRARRSRSSGVPSRLTAARSSASASVSGVAARRGLLDSPPACERPGVAAVQLVHRVLERHPTRGAGHAARDRRRRARRWPRRSGSDVAGDRSPPPKPAPRTRRPPARIAPASRAPAPPSTARQRGVDAGPLVDVDRARRPASIDASTCRPRLVRRVLLEQLARPARSAWPRPRTRGQPWRRGPPWRCTRSPSRRARAGPPG